MPRARRRDCKDTLSFTIVCAMGRRDCNHSAQNQNGAISPALLSVRRRSQWSLLQCHYTARPRVPLPRFPRVPLSVRLFDGVSVSRVLAERRPDGHCGCVCCSSVVRALQRSMRWSPPFVLSLPIRAGQRGAEEGQDDAVAVDKRGGKGQTRRRRKGGEGEGEEGRDQEATRTEHHTGAQQSREQRNRGTSESRERMS